MLKGRPERSTIARAGNSTRGTYMVRNERTAPFPVSPANHAAPAVGPTAEFDARWAAWIARGRVRERLVRRRFVLWAGVLATAAAAAYAFLHL
jgi:hypothetical protein